jgi:peptide/nickel transport system permease protein
MSYFWRKLLSNPASVIGLACALVVVFMAIFAPLLGTRDPLATSPDSFIAPSLEAWLGTDNLGRDIWSGVVYGSRVSLIVGLSASVISAVIGILAGSIAGFWGRTIDIIIMRITELFQVIPQFFLALILVALVGRGLDKVIFVLGILGWPLTARVVRGQFLSLKQREFTEASRALGGRDRYLVTRVLLPNTLAPVVVVLTQRVGQAILLEAGVSFFGLGDPNLISWGQMINSAQSFLYLAWWMSVFPGVAIFIAVLGFTLLGDGLNDALNPRWQRKDS